MTEDWIATVDRDPQAHRSVEEVTRLLECALDPDLQRRAASMNALARVVKALESDPIEASIAAIGAALPRLAEGLCIPDENIDGCTISVMRRIAVDEATVDRLLVLVEQVGDGDASLLIEALSHYDCDVWPEAIENAIARGLDAPESAYAAAYALYVGTRRIQQVDTIRRLDVAASTDDRLVRESICMALCRLLSRPALAPEGFRSLERLLDAGDVPTRAHMMKTLGWATDRGLPLLRRGACDPSPLVRSATAWALRRGGAAYGSDGAELLARLRDDADDAVREAARQESAR